MSRSTVPDPFRAFVEARQGRREQALRIITGKSFPKHLGTVASAYALVGDRDSVFAVLEQAARERSTQPMIFLSSAFDNLRHDPRFVPLLKRFQLPDDTIATMVDLPNRYPRQGNGA